MPLTLTPITAGSLTLSSVTARPVPDFLTQEPSGRVWLESHGGFILLEGSTGLALDPDWSVSLTLTPA